MRRKAKGSKQFSYYLERKDEFNVLCPSEGFLSASSLYTINPEIVLIDPDPINGEVYQVGDRNDQKGRFRDEFAITKRGLEKIGWAAGIQFHPRYTRRTDDGRNPRRVEFQAAGSIQKPDGSWYSVCRSKEINLDVIEQELRLEIEAVAQTEGLTVESEGAHQRLLYGTEECSREISLRLERQILKWRKNMVATADSGAYSRVVRSLLNIQPTYCSEELQKPFVVPSVSFDLEYLLSRRWAREHFIKAGLATTLSLYGPALRDDLSQHSVIPDGSCGEVDGRPEEGLKLTESQVNELRREDQTRRDESA
jgi:hypothetical protein